jgi:ABC-type nitrate/sulfonate/bicarbonate transport system substrate-binding protein
MASVFSRRSILAMFATWPAAIALASQHVPLGAQGLPVVRMGGVPIDPAGEPYYAYDLGNFKRAGIDVQIQTMTNSASITAAVIGGALDIGLCDLVTASNARGHGVGIVYIAPGSIFTPASPGHTMFVQKTSSLMVAKDLEGKVVAVNGLKGIDQITTQAWFNKHGADWQAIKFAEIPFPAMAAALDSGTVDAIIMTEPGWTLGKDRFRSFDMADTGIADRFMISGYIAMKTWADANKDVVRRFSTVIRETGRWANANHAATAEILAKISKIPPDVLSRMERSIYSDQLTPELLQPLIDAGVKYGAVPKSFPAAEIIYRA